MPKSNFSCRPDTVVGPWAMDPEVFHNYEQRVFDALGRGEFKIRSSDDSDAETSENTLSALPYVIDEHGLAHIDMSGPLTKYPTSFSSLIGGTSMIQAQMAFRQMASDTKVKAVMIHADSPGGTVSGAAELVNSIKKLDAIKPVVTHVDGRACSGMYWLSSATRYISASPTSEIGSVGAVMTLRDRSEMLEKAGIKTHVITNEGATKKGIGADGVPLTSEAKKDIERRLNDLVKPFQMQVQNARGLTEDQTSEIFKAGVYEATPALAKGLIDSIDFQEDAVQKIHEAMQSSNSPIFMRGKETRDSQSTTSRSYDMKFTPEQIQRAQKLPGCVSVADESAGSAETLIVATETLNAQVVSLKQENEQLKAKVKDVIPVPDQATLDEKVNLKNERIDLLVEKGNISKAQADTVKAAIKADPVGMICAAPGKKSAVDVMIETMGQGKVGIASGSQTGNQTLPNDPPAKDSPEAFSNTDEAKMAEEGRKQAEAHKTRRLQQLGHSNK